MTVMGRSGSLVKGAEHNYVFTIQVAIFSQVGHRAGGTAGATRHQALSLW